MSIKGMKQATVAFIVLVLVGLAGNSSAATVDAVNAGYWASFYSTGTAPADGFFFNQLNPSLVGSWIVGNTEDPNGVTNSVDYRSFAEFDLSGLQKITGATLVLDLAGLANPPVQPFDGYNSADAFETIQVRQYGEGGSNTVADLTTANAVGGGFGLAPNGLSVWSDLGDGLNWNDQAIVGNGNVSAADMGDNIPNNGPGSISIVLSAAAVSDLNAKRLANVTWAAGLFNSTIAPNSTAGTDSEILISNQFSGTAANVNRPQLVLSTVPIPAAAWLFGSGIIGLVGISRRRSRGA